MQIVIRVPRPGPQLRVRLGESTRVRPGGKFDSQATNSSQDVVLFPSSFSESF